MAETRRATPVEQSSPVERFSVSERSARLGNQNDAVCDGKSVRLSSLERSKTGTPTPDEKKQNAVDLAIRITELKKPGVTPGEPLFKNPPTADRLAQLTTELENLTKGRFSGLLVNIQATPGIDGDATSIGMFAFIDYLTTHQNATDTDALKGAQKAAQDVYLAMGIKDPPAFAAVLISEKGGMTSVHSKDVAIVSVDDKGKTVIPDAEDPQVTTVEKGQKIILCNAVAVSAIPDGKTSVDEIVDGLATPKVEQKTTGPITENIFYRRHATIIPDIHGGKSGAPKGESPLEDFTHGRREGEVFVSAGDVFDRGERSWQAAQEMMEMVGKGEAVWNLGNHELLFMAAMSGASVGKPPSGENMKAFLNWYTQGGKETLHSAGVDTADYDKDPLKFFQQIRGNKEIVGLSTFLEDHGNAYTIVDSVLVTHAGFPVDPATGELREVIIDGESFGKGIEAMDKIQTRIRNRDEKVIGWLAVGYKEYGDNPFWVRDEFQTVAESPGLAHVLRGQLNEQLKIKNPPGTKIELIVLGHTPDKGDMAGKTISIGPKGPPKFLFTDTGYYKDGSPRVVQLTVSESNPDKVVAEYLDPKTGEKVIKNGLPIVHHRYQMSGRVSEVPAQGPAHGASGETVTAEDEKRVEPPKPKGPDSPPAVIPGETIVLKKVTYENDTDKPPVKVKDYMEGEEYKENVEWLGRVIGIIKSSDSTDPLVSSLKPKEGESEKDYTERVVGELVKHLTATGENQGSPLFLIAQSAEIVPPNGENPDRGGELMTLDAVAIILRNAPELYDPSFRTPEAGGNPEEVKVAFDEAFGLYQVGMSTLEAKEPSTLSPSEKETLARYRYTKKAYDHAKRVDPENWQLEVELRAHGEMPSHMISEGVPVEGVIIFLDAEIKSLENPTEPVEKARLEKLSHLRNILFENSKLYKKIPLKDRHEKEGEGKKFRTIGALMEARQQLEANERHLDLLRTSHNQNDQARMQEDWDQGGRDLEVRRELVVTKKAKTITDNLGVVYKKTTDEREIIKRIVEPEPIDPAPDVEPEDVDPHPPIAPPPPRVITENDLQVQVVVAKDDTHMIKRNNDLVDHMMSKAETSGTHWYSRVPLLGGVVGSLLHPVQNIWRNGLARESVREQNRRFVDRMGITLKSHFVGREGVGREEIRGQMRIPVEVTSELIDRSLEEGKKLLKKQGLMTRLWWGGRNALARITTLGETSQMHFAKQWLGDNLVENTAGERDPLIESIYTRALNEQDAVASRIAIKGLRRGERRVEVANSPLAAPVKDAIAAYFAEITAAEVTDVDKRNRLISEARTRLVAKINTIGKGSSGGEIDLSTGIELASNILSVVDNLSHPLGETGKSKWQVLQEEDKWKDFKINITTAESRWGAEGGDTPMSKLRENVLKRMAERELFVGENERTHGVELAIRSITSDIATYGGAFLLGAGTSTALFGARTVSKLVGGLGGIMGMSAAKEMGLRVGGREVFRGRYRGEVAQVSKETALGKKGSNAARIRGEMGKALVEPGMMENADTIAVRIENLLTKDPGQMTEREAYQMLREIAQLDARMRIADISGTKDLQFTTQNYIIYDELQRNEQYLRLKSNVLAGLQKLTLYKGLHSDFGHGEDISSGIQIEYGKAQGSLGMFEKFSVLAEAQLRLGSRVEVLKWLQDTNNLVNNNAGVGMSKDDAQRLMDEYYSAAKGTVDQEQTIRSKERVLRRLATKRAATVVLQSALMMPIGGVVVGVEYQILSGVVQEVQHVVREGIPAWSSDWAAVISGNGTSTHALSPFQTGVLTVRHTIENAAQTEILPAHDEVIDGIHVQLPGEYKYVSGPNGVDKIVDLHGNMVKDLSNVDLHVVDGKLVETNAAGQIVNNDALADFHASGVSIHQGDVLTVNGTETVLNPTGAVVDQSFDGHTMHVPEGTEWIKDTQGNSDLVVVGHHDVVLIDNAQIGADGLITGGVTHEGVTIETATHTIPGESSQEIHISGPDGILTQNHDTYSRSEQQNMYGGTQENGFDYHRPIYDYKETNPDTGDAVYVIQAGRGEILYPAHDPNITFNVPQEMAEGHLYFTLTVPGHGNIVMPANYSAGGDNLHDALRLDPSDTTSFVTPQGHEFTYGEVAKMFVDQENLQNHPDGILGTEYNNIWTEILHLTASDSPHSGTIASSILGDNGVLYHFGVVRGGAPLQDTISTESSPTITTESLISITGPVNTAVTENIPTFIIDAPAVVNTPIPIVIPLIPVPMGRENVEPVEGGIASQEKTVPPVQTLPPQVAVPVASDLVVSEEEKKRIQAEVDSAAYASPNEMMKKFGLEQTVSFGKYGTEAEKRASNARFVGCQKAFATYEVAKRAFEHAPESAKKQKEREFENARSALMRALRGREGKFVGTSPFEESQIDELNVFIDEQKQKKLQLKIAAAEKKKVEDKKKEDEEKGDGAVSESVDSGEGEEEENGGTS